jgi:hypothetical protein
MFKHLTERDNNIFFAKKIMEMSLQMQLKSAEIVKISQLDIQRLYYT